MGSVAYFIRELDDGDVLLMHASGPLGSTTPSIKKLRQSHHKLAQLLARGVKETEVSFITGYSISRISILKNDPAFKNLLSYYAEHVEQTQVDVIERLREVGMDAVEILHERLIESDDMTTGELVKTVELMLDRAGFGPKSTVKHETGFDANTIEALKKRLDSEARGNVIEAQSYKEIRNSADDTSASFLPRCETEDELSASEGDRVSETSRPVSQPER